MQRQDFLRAALALPLLLNLPAGAQAKGLVGISMPTRTSPRWIADGDNMVRVFREKGYATDLQYADDDVPNQLAQLENMLTKGAKVLVIVAIDGSTLSGVLKKAADRGAKIVAYDRLIRGTPHVDAYATFDNFQVGVMQAQSIVSRLGLPQAAGPFNIELFAGSPDDNNAAYFYDGALSVLKPFLDSGKLVVRSRQTGAMKVGILRWDSSAAQARMENLLSAFYGKDRLHAVLAPADVLSVGIIAALKAAGYGTARLPMPVVTGQDADLSAVRAIRRGEQASTVFKDTRALARVTAQLVDALLSGQAPDINDRKTYNNGVKVVPAHLLKPVAVDAGNWKAVLVDSGYYTEAQVR